MDSFGHTLGIACLVGLLVLAVLCWWLGYQLWVAYEQRRAATAAVQLSGNLLVVAVLSTLGVILAAALLATGVL